MSLEGPIMTGEEFNKLNSSKLIKFINKHERINYFINYKTGLNIDTKFKRKQGKGLLYFCKFENYISFNSTDPYIREVTVPDDARIYIEDDKIKADRLILSERFDTIEYLLLHGKCLKRMFGCPELLYATEKNGNYIIYINKADIPNDLIYYQVISFNDSTKIVEYTDKTFIGTNLNLSKPFNPVNTIPIDFFKDKLLVAYDDTWSSKYKKGTNKNVKITLIDNADNSKIRQWQQQRRIYYCRVVTVDDNSLIYRRNSKYYSDTVTLSRLHKTKDILEFYDYKKDYLTIRNYIKSYYRVNTNLKLKYRVFLDGIISICFYTTFLLPDIAVNIYNMNSDVFTVIPRFTYKICKSFCKIIGGAIVILTTKA